MDYPWSKNYEYAGNIAEGLRRSFCFALHGITTLEEARVWHEHDVRIALEGPWQAQYYVGWRRKVRRAKAMLRGFLAWV